MITNEYSKQKRFTSLEYDNDIGTEHWARDAHDCIKDLKNSDIDYQKQVWIKNILNAQEHLGNTETKLSVSR